MTPKQQECLQFVTDYIGRKGYSPTYTEIGEALDCNKVAAYSKVNALCRRGFLTKTYGAHRSIQLRQKTVDVIDEGDLAITFRKLFEVSAENEDIDMSGAMAETIRYFVRIRRYDTERVAKLLDVKESLVWNALCRTDHLDGRGE